MDEFPFTITCPGCGDDIEMCDGKVQAGEGHVRHCRLRLDHIGDCQDERGWLGQPSQVWKENSLGAEPKVWGAFHPDRGAF